MRSWLDFEERFRKLPPALQSLRLDFQWGSEGEYWRICGTQTGPTIRQVEALIRLAGQALEECAARCQDLQELVAVERTPENKCFRALNELSGDFRDMLPCRVTGEDGEFVGYLYHGSLANVVDVSANLCLNLHARYPMVKDKTGEHGTINILNSTVGMLNTGGLKGIDSILINVSNLRESGAQDVAEAFCKLTEALRTETSLDTETRSAVLEQIEELSR